VRARLQHLGYLRPVAPGDGDGLDRAVRTFQTDKGLESTGELTQPTLDALVKSYGS
jgi:peptidoglycan hydrolase-like protein with peptidoglycan-binding domain